MVAFLVVFLALGRLYREMFKQPETRGLLLIAGAVILVAVAFYSRVEGWSLLDSFYFCVVTLETVGYGDITPTTDLGKIFTIFYIIVGLTVIGGFFATAAKVIGPGEKFSREKAELGHDMHLDEEGARKQNPPAQQ